MARDINDGKTFEATAIKRYEVGEDTNRSIPLVDSIVLSNGPKVQKRASHFLIIDSHTGITHHHAIKIETYKKAKGGTSLDEKHSILVDDDDEDEISRLATFLCAVRDMPKAAGDYLAVPIGSDRLKRQAILQIVNAISTSDKVASISELLLQLRGNPDLLHLLARRVAEDPQVSKEATAAFNFARFTAAVEKLEELIESDALETLFQNHLAEHPWMFGSEYSELLDRRKYTRDEQQDFMVRRTADGYLEVIEIKRPLAGKPLFKYDISHKAYYPSEELSKVIGQVTKYLEKLDGDRNTINYDLGEDVTKIRAKIIIGQNGDAEQRKALRRLNGHLHRIEILTFDQLLQIARQVVKYQEQILSSPEEHEDDI